MKKLLFMLLLVAFTSCSKEKVYKLVRTTTSILGEPKKLVEIYEYNDNRQLIKTTSLNGSDTVSSTSHKYIGDRLVSQKDSDGYSTEYIYSEKGLVSTIILDKTTIYNYTYGKDGFLKNYIDTKDNCKSSYIYNEQGNISLFLEPCHDLTISYEYDSMINPYVTSYPLVINKLLHYSVNNITKKNVRETEFTFRHEYNAKNYPVKRSKYKNGKLVSVREFFYKEI